MLFYVNSYYTLPPSFVKPRPLSATANHYQNYFGEFGFLIPILTFSGFFAFYRLHKDRIIDATAN